MPNYAAMYQKNPHHLKKIRESIKDLSGILKPEDTLLDAGCCEGHLYDALNHPGKYTGIDIVDYHIAEAKKRHPDVDFRVGNILELTGKWEIVWCARVLMHLPDYEGNVRKLLGLANKKLIVSVPIGMESLETEESKFGTVEFRSYSAKRIGETNPEQIIKHPQYSTVIYDPRLS